MFLIYHMLAVARFAGCNLFTSGPGVTLAKPRSTPGFMLAPALQVSLPDSQIPVALVNQT
jgi:hypothetical protein